MRAGAVAGRCTKQKIRKKAQRGLQSRTTLRQKLSGPGFVWRGSILFCHLFDKKCLANFEQESVCLAHRVYCGGPGHEFDAKFKKKICTFAVEQWASLVC